MTDTWVLCESALLPLYLLLLCWFGLNAEHDVWAVWTLWVQVLCHRGFALVGRVWFGADWELILLHGALAVLASSFRGNSGTPPDRGACFCLEVEFCFSLPGPAAAGPLLRYHLYGWTKSHIDHTKFWGEYGAIGTTVSLLWECKWCSHFERHFGNFSQNWTYSCHRIQCSDSLVFTQMSPKLVYACTCTGYLWKLYS